MPRHSGGKIDALASAALLEYETIEGKHIREILNMVKSFQVLKVAEIMEESEKQDDQSSESPKRNGLKRSTWH